MGIDGRRLGLKLAVGGLRRPERQRRDRCQRVGKYSPEPQALKSLKVRYSDGLDRGAIIHQRAVPLGGCWQSASLALTGSGRFRPRYRFVCKSGPQRKSKGVVAPIRLRNRNLEVPCPYPDHRRPFRHAIRIYVYVAFVPTDLHVIAERPERESHTVSVVNWNGCWKFSVAQRLRVTR